MKISVLVPSYGRPESLASCLSALANQDRAPDEVIVVTRREDAGTRALVKRLREDGSLRLREEVVDVPGQVMALEAGCRGATGDVVAITDDDAAPRSDWLEKLQRRFADPQVIGVGGRDAVVGLDGEAGKPVVGLVRWWGKVIGNHHLGTGEPREVDVLKGVNMAFRRKDLLAHGFDARLKGRGAQVHNDLKLSLALRREEHCLIYDPNLVVDHMPAERPEGDDRLEVDPSRQEDAVHNETLALLEFLPPVRRAVFAAWALAIGRAPGPGLLHAAWTSVRRPRTGSWLRLRATLRGRREGWHTYRGSSTMP
jgi:GT2 family glycosyltransferase